MDRHLLKALGYSDETLNRMEKWDTEVSEYFKNVDNYKTRLESYYQADYKNGIIAFRDTCPKNISDDLRQIFDNIFNTPKD